MKYLISTLLCLLSVTVFAANPTYNSFLAADFTNNGVTIGINAASPKLGIGNTNADNIWSGVNTYGNTNNTFFGNLNSTGGSDAYQEGITHPAKIPYLGFSTWETMGSAVNEISISNNLETAKSWSIPQFSGPNKPIFEIDDGVFTGRDSNGILIANTNNFPKGLTNTVNLIHSYGWDAMIYVEPNLTTSDGTYGSGSGTNLEFDMAYFARIGFDGVRLDSTGWAYGKPTDWIQKRAMTAFKSAVTNKPGYFWFGNSIPDPQMTGVADISHLAGTDWTGATVYDVYVKYLSMIDNWYSFSRLSKPGNWLIINKAYLNISSSQVATNIAGLWAVAGSPIILTGIYSSPGTVIDCITNMEMLDIDRDQSDAPVVLVSSNASGMVFSRILSDKSIAVHLLNRTTNTTADIGFDRLTVGAMNNNYNIRDIWQHSNLGRFKGTYTNSITAMASQTLRLYPIPPQIDTGYIVRYFQPHGYWNGSAYVPPPYTLPFTWAHFGGWLQSLGQSDFFSVPASDFAVAGYTNIVLNFSVFYTNAFPAFNVSLGFVVWTNTPGGFSASVMPFEITSNSFVFQHTMGTNNYIESFLFRVPKNVLTNAVAFDWYVYNPGTTNYWYRSDSVITNYP